jgi:host factor-I protein
MTSGKAQINLQDGFLNQVRKESSLVTLFLVNGCKLRGIVRGFDNFTIVLESDGKQHLVYKHAVSTISPVSPCDHQRTSHCERTPQGGEAPASAKNES